MEEKLDSKTLFKSRTDDFRGILNMLHNYPAFGDVKAIYFRCVDWNPDMGVTLWFRIMDNAKMQAYRVLDGRMARLDGFEPEFRMTIKDMFRPFEYILEH